MLWPIVASLILSLALVSAKKSPRNRLAKAVHSYDEDSTFYVNYQTAKAHADMGFYAFSYGAPRTMAYQSYLLKLRKTAQLTVTDCYCPGDKFQIFDNGVPILTTDQCPPTVPTDCSGLDTNAWSCMTNANFCHGQVLLNAGYHNLTFAVISSPSGGGAGFFRIDTLCAPTMISPFDPAISPPWCCLLETDTTDITKIGRLCNQMVQWP